MERAGQRVVPGSPVPSGRCGTRPAQCGLPAPSASSWTSERPPPAAPMQVLRKTAADCSRWRLRPAVRAVSCSSTGRRGSFSGCMQPPSASPAVESSTAAAAAPAVAEPPAQTSTGVGAQAQASRKPGGYPFAEIEAKWQRCGGLLFVSCFAEMERAMQCWTDSCSVNDEGPSASCRRSITHFLPVSCTSIQAIMLP